MTAGDLLWSPPADIREHSAIGAYLRWLEEQRGLHFPGYHELWCWSVEELAPFWSSIWEYFDVGSGVAEPVVTPVTMPGARWFPHGRVNYAERVLRIPGRADTDPAIIAYSQTRETSTLTVSELRDQVARCAAGLLRLGIQRGDRVAAYLPNIPETVVLLLACAGIGAVFSSCAPEFGLRSVTDRWSQIEPALLVAVDGYRYGDKAVQRRAEVEQLRTALPTLRTVVSVSYLDGDIPGTLPWRELLAEPAPTPEWEQLPCDHPLYVLYSSGTTGLPKPIIHGHGGILLEHLKMLALQHDLGPEDRFFWFTTTGWMMWNYLVSGLAVGATIVLFDGNPAWPDLQTLWSLAQDAQLTYLGTSAPFLLACRKNAVEPGPLPLLRGVGSTGAPLPPEGFRWVYEHIGHDLVLSSLSGGTDICTGFVGGVPLLPVYEGEITCRCLGARVEAFSHEGKPLLGQLGELVITAPMPSMPVGLWGDSTGERYREAYFATYPGVWRHGDWITITPRGTCIITGRSDATLNRGGVRLGTAEFYSVVEALPTIVDSLVIHLEDPGGGAGTLLLFVVLADGAHLDDALRARITGELRAALSPRHVPDEILRVSAIPKTLSGKKLEVPVKKILTGTSITDAAAEGALANPESLREFAAFVRRLHP